MNNNIIIINGPNLNLLGEREQSQYGSITFDQLRKNCLEKATFVPNPNYDDFVSSDHEARQLAQQLIK